MQRRAKPITWGSEWIQHNADIDNLRELPRYRALRVCTSPPPAWSQPGSSTSSTSQPAAASHPVRSSQLRFANPLTTAITIDVYWSAVVFSAWAIAERRRATSPSPWLCIALCFAIGLAFAFPLYLGRRQQLGGRQAPAELRRSPA